MRGKLNEIRAVLGLNAGTDAAVTGVSTDTRRVQPGDLFVALRGERFDGHDYADKALSLGAIAVVVDTAIPGRETASLVVPDTRIAYGQIARAWRRRFQIPMIGVTGSVGKTTMKEMIALALSPLGPVLKSEKNENNEIGVPRTLLRLNETHKAAVIEMGMRGAGQIKYLAEIAEPTIGVVTVIGESHIELLGSREAIADAKGELLEALPPGGVAALNRDDTFFSRLRQNLPNGVRLVTFGESPEADVQFESARRVEDGWAVVLESREFKIQSPARHDVANALGAIAVAQTAGVGLDAALGALEHYAPSEMRIEVVKTASGATILSDGYNAAPTSVKSALGTLADFPASGRKIAFLGDMKELGGYSETMHRDVADMAHALGLTVVPVGPAMRQAFGGAAKSFETSDEAAEAIRSEFLTKTDDVILVKGSRAMAMERIVEALTT